MAARADDLGSGHATTRISEKRSPGSLPGLRNRNVVRILASWAPGARESDKPPTEYEEIQILKRKLKEAKDRIRELEKQVEELIQ